METATYHQVLSRALSCKQQPILTSLKRKHTFEATREVGSKEEQAQQKEAERRQAAARTWPVIT